MRDVYVASSCRTAIGSFGGSLAAVPAPQLGAVVLSEAVKRAGIEVASIDEVYFGCVLQTGLGQNVARQVALAAGLPEAVPATTVNMVCGSGMKTVVEGMRAIRSGDADIVAVGGCENMSAAPYLSGQMRFGSRMGDVNLVDCMVRDGLWDVFNDYHMGITAENVCEKWGLLREELDEFAFQSQKKTADAIKHDRFRDEIVPVAIRQKRETVLFDTDEYPRETSLEKLASLRPAFKKDSGMVTAGNASGINDGAAALILVSENALKKYGIEAAFKITGWGQSGIDPAIMGIGPVEASRRALQKAGLVVDDIDLVEANEAFAAQSLAVMRELTLDPDTTNVNGGAIALGHPIGASGARIIVTLLHEMARRPNTKHGLATLCIGGGMGIATVFEKCSREGECEQ
ncbi:acetyl-CoA C-acetyltransferase [Ruminococcaceae bacterium OttesenSCG-928-D13]|nr:acetyl-CoA C-acetyltransferase [Ruminococcaceae bacterium OttesenSCG-928-D13]